jgi:HPt (histidine-containing phosphotransfer) domain-containing protein
MGSIDLGRIQDLLDVGDVEFIATLVGIYLSETPGKVDRLAKALEDADPSGAAEVAHSIKSSSLNMGALALAGIADRIQQSCEAHDLPTAQMALKSLRAELARVQTELERLSKAKAA